jgi:hypothetical protein
VLKLTQVVVTSRQTVWNFLLPNFLAVVFHGL